ELRFPHSLGLLYSAFTQYLGFGVNDGEYKVMGLAPFGEPAHVQHILDNLMDLKDDGSFRLRLDCFDYCVGLTMINRRFESLFDGAPPRRAGQPLERRHLDIARSIQAVAEEVVLRLSRHLHRVTGLSNLCMAGGVALNCVANGRVLREGPFDRIWIQPAAGDAGGALGAALSVAHVYGQTRRADGATDAMNGALLGPAFDDDEIRAILDGQGAVYECLEDRALFETVADALASEKVVGWFQDRMEFGPRALGNRSILGDPRSPAMQRLLNRKIKYREGFRPFAPAVLRDRAGEYFQLAGDSPYMLLVAPVTPAHRRPLTADETARTGLEMLDV
ncbi:MAG: hypothetical protein K8F57_00310, partial [Alphaproteobacteria bacterium]|nr:hypothetical protein [Alphaproteobacteria bacterium]